jgi:uncharacterized protein (TIGR00251 family)
VTETPFAAHPEGVLVKVWVVPRSSRSEVKGVHNGRIKVRVAVPPEEGRANAEVIRLLAEHLEADVELVGGFAGRDKLFLARGIDVEAARAKHSL